MSYGEPPKKSRKRESGAQLLARLNSRTDLSSLDPDIFNKVSSSMCSSSSGGQIIELYGPEGTGKTELILHYVARACLPSHWNGLVLNGLGSKVIFIDTEFKFSIFRLAIVMEKQILALQEKAKQNYIKNELFTQNCAHFSSSIDTCNENNSASDIVEESSFLRTEDSRTQLCQKNVPSESISLAGKETMSNISGVRESVQGKRDESSSYSIPDHHEKQSRTVTQPELTAQHIEDIVQDSLGRVQVMNVLNTEQLLFSLLSLEHTLSSDPLISIIAIDTISAFYWTDKLQDLDNFFITNTKMSPVADTISRLVSEFGVTFLVTKSALIGEKRIRNGNRDGMRSGCGVSNSGHMPDFGDSTVRGERELRGHVEFLGKSWSSLSKKIIVLSRTVDGIGGETRRAWSSDWPVCRVFTCTDGGLTFG